MKQVHIHLTERQYDILHKRSELTGCSIASIIRNLVTNDLLEGET